MKEFKLGQNSKEVLKLFLRSTFFKAALKYFFVGGLSAIIDWSMFAVLRFGIDLHYLLSGTFSFLVATAANYYMSSRFVFEPGRRGRNEKILLLYLVSGIGLGFHLVILSVGVNVVELHDMWAKIIATGAVFIWNFSARYYFVFPK